MAVNQDTLYVKGDRNVEVTKREVTLGDLVSMECSNRVILPHLKTMKVLKIPENGEKRYVISILKIIACILINSHGISPPPSGSGSLLSAVPATYLSSHSKLLRSLLLPLPGLSDTTLFFVFHFPL